MKFIAFLLNSQAKGASCKNEQSTQTPSNEAQCSCIGLRPALILTICHCFDNLEFKIFDAGGPQSHFIMSVTITVGFKVNAFSALGQAKFSLLKDQSKPLNVWNLLIYVFQRVALVNIMTYILALSAIWIEHSF